MPELPEVEVLARHLAPRLAGKRIQRVRVLDPRSLSRVKPATFKRTLIHAHFQSLRRHGKYLLFTMRKGRASFPLLVHLGMTGRLSLSRNKTPLARHSTVEFGLGGATLVFDDVRRFGRMRLDASPVHRLGPEPLETGFTVEKLQQALGESRQAIKVRLLDQTVVAGIGNIYASEALFHARIHPCTPSRNLNQTQLCRLRTAIRRVLSEAIRFGSTVPLEFSGPKSSGELFYYGQSADDRGRYEERLRVYDREGNPCRRCGVPVERTAQAGRSTYFCPCCQGAQDQ